MNKKPNKTLLQEELNKFRLLSEYSFYTGPDENNSDKVDNNLILGDLEEADEDNPDKDLEPVDPETDAIGDDAENLGFGDEKPDDDNEISAAKTEEPPVEEPVASPIEEPAEEEIDLDVTELVNKTDEAKKSADMSNHKIDQLLSKYDELNSKLSTMNNITNKIDNLEREIEKRVPTPQEKLEMRSLNSYPYSLKLTDYWSEKAGPYNVMDNGEKKPKEYILKKDDIDSSYNETNVKDSFNDFEEEELDEI